MVLEVEYIRELVSKGERREVNRIEEERREEKRREDNRRGEEREDSLYRCDDDDWSGVMRFV